MKIEPVELNPVQLHWRRDRTTGHTVTNFEFADLDWNLYVAKTDVGSPGYSWVWQANGHGPKVLRNAGGVCKSKRHAQQLAEYSIRFLVASENKSK